MKTKKNEMHIPSGDNDQDFDAIVTFATANIVDRKYLEPTLFIIDSKKKKMGMIKGGELPYDSDYKIQLFENIGKQYASKLPGADMFVFAMETWVSLGKGKSPSYFRPHEDPYRIEAYMVNAKRGNGDEKYFAQAFKRDKDGKVEMVDVSEIKAFNMDWVRSGSEENETKNNLLSALWRSFMFTKIVNKMK